ncbi:MAG: SH3 domain protein [Gammaproteobacteria bacterium]|jgi:SH3 domain protein
MKYLSILLTVIASWAPSVQAQNLDNIDADPDQVIMYVTDQLRLSLYEQPDSSSRVIKLLSSGDRLVIHETAGPYAFVSISSDRKGWVKKGFLVSNPTSNLLLAVLKEKNEALAARLQKLSNSNVVVDQYEKDMDVMSADLVKADKSLVEAEQTITTLNESMAALQLQLDDSNKEPEPVASAEEQIEEPTEVSMSDPEEDSVTTTISPITIPMLQPVLENYKQWLYFGLKHWVVILPTMFGLFLLGVLIGKATVEARIRRRFHGLKVW